MVWLCPEAWLLALCWSTMTCSGQLFIDSPGTKKHHPGDTLTMEWRLSETFDPSINPTATMQVDHGGSVLIYETDIVCDNFGDSRLSCISPGTVVGFAIGGSGVTDSDAGGYSCHIKIKTFGSEDTNSDAFLYIYKSPTEPTIIGNSPTPVGDALTLQCFALPQSLPLNQSASAHIQYTWTSSGLPLSPSGDTVIVGPLNKEDLGKTVTCVANEQDSTLSSNQQVTINVTFAPVTTLLKANSVIVVERVDNLFLECTIPAGQEGNPDFYTYKWMNPDPNIEPTETAMTLTIDKDSLDSDIHEGTWSCSASNVAGDSLHSELEITVNSGPVVTTDLFDTSFIVNETLTIECQFRAKPQTAITWKFNNGNLPTEVLIVSNSSAPDGVYISSSSIINWKGTDLEARKTVGGQYRCDASNGITGVVSSATMTLQVKYPPGISVVDADTDIVVENQDDLVLKCTLPPGQQGIPDSYTFSWENLNTGFTKDTGTTNELIIASGMLDASQHDGNWQCLPRNEIDHGSPGSKKVTVTAIPVVHKDLVDLNVTINASLHMECSFKAKPKAAISWIHNNTVEPSTDAFIISNSDTPSGVYTISSSVIRWKPGSDIILRRAVNGFYKCEGDHNPTGSGVSHNMRLNIHFGPLSIDFGVDGPQEEVTEPSQVTRSCFADCNPACSYHWTNLTSGSVVSNSQTLDISSAGRYDDGEYRCTAQNGIWDKSNDFDLKVNFPPEPKVSISNENNLIQGNSTSLACTVESRPLSVITLRNMTDNSVLPTDDSDNLAVHHIASVDCLQSGNYSCSATNDIPSNGHTVMRALVMDIKCPPRVSQQDGYAAISIGGNYTFEAHLISNPSPSIPRNSWTFIPENDTRSVALPPNAYIDQGQPEAGERLTIVPQLHIIDVDVYNFGKYLLTTSNLLSEPLTVQFVLTPQGPPSIPSKPELLCGSAVSLTIYWMADFHGGFPQTFTVLYTAAGDTEKEQSVIHDPDVNKGDIVVHKLTGIESDTTYTIRIKAENSFPGDNVVYGNADFYDTKAIPILASGTELQLNSTHLMLRSTLLHVGSVSHIIFKVCTDTDELPSCSPELNITVTSADLSVTLELPEDKDNSYEVKLTMFDCHDIVNTTILTAVVGNQGSNKPAAIAGGVVAAVIGVAVTIIILLLWKRGVFGDKATKEKREQDVVHYENSIAQSPIYNEIPTDSNDHNAYQELNEYHMQPVETSQYEGIATATVNMITSPCTTVVGVISESALYRVLMASTQGSREDKLPRRLVTKSVKDEHNLLHKKYLEGSAEVMVKLINCDNVIHCLGLLVESNELLLEHVEFGNMRQYLTGVTQGTYVNSTRNHERDLISFIQQAANGASAVAELLPEALFYCLSLEHVLLRENFCIKLTGFSLAKCVRDREEDEDRLKLPRPLRWLAPEAIDLRHCIASDVWAFGVLMWEILSQGETPFENIPDPNIRSYIAKGGRLEKPEQCSDSMFDLMSECWKLKANNRPKMNQVKDVLVETTIYQNV